MSKKRTKADKIRAAARVQEVRSVFQPQPTLPEAATKLTLPEIKVIKTRPTAVATSKKTTPLWRFNPSLIYQDLLKTALASALIVGILVLIYWLSF